MKTQEEIQEFAEKYADGYRCPPTNENEYCKHDIISAYNNGYTQCQEDMAAEMENCMRFFLKHTQKQITDRIAKESPEDFDVAKEVVKFYIQSLNKQD